MGKRAYRQPPEAKFGPRVEVLVSVGDRESVCLLLPRLIEQREEPKPPEVLIRKGEMQNVPNGKFMSVQPLVDVMMTDLEKWRRAGYPSPWYG